MRRTGQLAAFCMLFVWVAVGVADDDDERAAAVKGAKITPMEATLKAGKEVDGGKVFELEVEVDDGVPNYEIRIAYFGEKHTIDVACATGEIIKRSHRGDPRLGLIKWSKVKVPIEKAMETALQRIPGGQIIEVDITNGGFEPRFEVIVMCNGKKTEVHVDTQTGQIVRVEDD